MKFQFQSNPIRSRSNPSVNLVLPRRGADQSGGLRREDQRQLLRRPGRGRPRGGNGHLL